MFDSRNELQTFAVFTAANVTTESHRVFVVCRCCLFLRFESSSVQTCLNTRVEHLSRKSLYRSKVEGEPLHVAMDREWYASMLKLWPCPAVLLN